MENFKKELFEKICVQIAPVIIADALQHRVKGQFEKMPNFSSEYYYLNEQTMGWVQEKIKKQAYSLMQLINEANGAEYEVFLEKNTQVE